MVEFSKVFRTCLQVGLLIAFFAALLNSLKQLWGHETSVTIVYEHGTPIPALTICPDDFPIIFDSNTTLAQVASLEDPIIEKHIVEGYLFQMNSSDHAGPSDYQEMNVTALNPSPYVAVFDSLLYKCVSLKPSLPVLQSKVGLVKIVVNMTQFSRMTLEMAEPGQSRLNSDLNYKALVPLQRGKSKEIFLTATKTIAINVPNHPCNEDNNHSVARCVDDYINSELLGCTLPWLANQSSSGPKRICNSIQDLTNYLDSMIYLNTQEVYDIGCYTLNCETVQWEMVKTVESYMKAEQSNMTALRLMFQNSQPVTVLKHSIVYGFSNFVADFGGYLGLLLGASLLSIYDSSVAMITKIS